MLAGVKKCLDSNDVIGLRYIFADSLDVDPTFETYKDGYEVSRRRDGFFESHTEITPFRQSGWDMDYWLQLKIDLSNNFSEKRFEHMIEVAKVVYKDKIERLSLERSAAAAAKPAANAAPPPKPIFSSALEIDPEEEQRRRIAEKRRQLEEDNRKVEAQQRQQRTANRANTSQPTTKPNSKNRVGVAIGIAAAVVIVGVGVIIIFAP